MFERLKQVLVQSFVGAIALGLLLSTTIGHLVAGLTGPITNWLLQNQYRGSRPMASWFPLQNAVSELIKFVVLLVIWYLLLTWLYMEPVRKESDDSDIGSAPADV
jgi:hypothetical protein